MKKLLLLSTFLVLAISQILATTITPSTITEVCVYKRGAKITRTAQVSLPAGKSTIELIDLTTHLNINSIQVQLDNSNVDLLDISYQVTYPVIKENPIVKDSLIAVQKEKKWLEAQQKTLEGELKIIQKNDKIYSNSTGVNTEELRKLTRFYTERSNAIRKELIELPYQKMALEEIERALKKRLKQKNGPTKYGVLSLNVAANTAATTNISFSYVCTKASWLPLYDIRSEGMGKNLQLSYKARIYNTTGYDWENVLLSLSSAAASVSQRQPVLKPLFVDYNQGTRVDTVITFDPETYEEQIQIVKFEHDKSIVEELPTSFLYNLNQRQSIPFDGKGHTINVRTETMPVEYEYFCVPRLRNEVFLLANVLNYGQYQLLPGKANIFFKDTYVGETNIDGSSITDTLQLSLGQDNSIVVERTKQDYTKEKLLGVQKKKQYAYTISVRNNKSIPISIKILDQIPISTQKSIEIKLLEKSKADYANATGLLTWELNLSPNETQSLPFSYSIKYPKEKGLREYY